MIRSFPDNPKGYYFAGLSEYQDNHVKRGCKFFKESVDLGAVSPQSHHMLGVCLINDLDEAKKYFARNVIEYPFYAPSFTGLGRYYLFNGKLDEAVVLLEKGAALAPSYQALGYLIQIYLNQGKVDAAQSVLRRGREALTDAQQVRSLHNFFDPSKFTAFPVDIGI